MKKKQSYTAEKIADLYLTELTRIRDKYVVEERQLIYESEPPLDIFLDRLNIYYDYELLVNCLALLEKSDLVSVRENVRRPVGGPENSAFFGKTIASVFITDEGIRFSQSGQVLDKSGQAEKAAERKKTQERLLNAGIAFGTAVLTMLIKWFFFDRK